MFIDAVDEEVLLVDKRLGAQFVAETAYSFARDICERLQLPLVRNHKQTSELASNRNGNGHPPIANSRRL